MKQGDPVSLEFVSSDATTAAAITIKDSDNVTRALKSYERLLIDSLTLAADPTTAVRLDIFDDKDADGTVDAGELLGSVYGPDGRVDGGGEGISVSIGSTPKAKASAAGAVRLTGVGRIINGATPLGRMPWRESLVPGV